MRMQPSPSAYTENYVAARLHGLTTADNYIKHTGIGDPELDPVMEELSSLPSEDLHRFIGTGIEQRNEVLRTAPQALRDVFDQINDPPSWLDCKTFDPAIRAFYTKATDILLALVTGVLIEGFSTLMSKSFSITGRMLQETDTSIRQLKQVNPSPARSIFSWRFVAKRRRMEAVRTYPLYSCESEATDEIC